MSRIAEAFVVEHPKIVETDETSEAWVRAVSAMISPLAWYFRFRLDGIERLPEGPCLVVANHSVGAVHEILLLLRAVSQRLPARRLRGLAHRVAWWAPLRSLRVVQKIGGVLAHPESAKRALADDAVLLVFPGGEVEALRPFSERDRVTLGGRDGFVRIARSTGVPIVPLVICGAHAGYFVLPGAAHPWLRAISMRLIHFKRFPLTVGFVGFVATGAATVLSPALLPALALSAINVVWPLPTRIEAEILAPLAPISPDDPRSDAEIAAEVVAQMQAAMDALSKKRATPWG